MLLAQLKSLFQSTFSLERFFLLLCTITMVVTPTDAFTSRTMDLHRHHFLPKQQNDQNFRQKALWQAYPATTDDESSVDNESLAQTTPHQHLVLIGGGHAHAQVLKALRNRPLDQLRVTLIDPQAEATYSGMVPGCIAGLYDARDTQIDIRALAEWAHLDFVQDRVIDIDFDQKLVYTRGNPNDNDDVQPLAYDAVSIDIGSTSRHMDDGNVPGVRQYTIPTRPIADLVRRLQTAANEYTTKMKDSREHSSSPLVPCRLVVVGGGVAGIELACAVHTQFTQATGETPHTTILNAGSMLLPDASAEARQRLHKILQERGIAVQHRAMVNRVEETCVVLETQSGQSAMPAAKTVPFDHCIWATGAAAHPLAWHLQHVRGLDVTNHGWIQVDEHLQSTSHEGVFAAGDCAHIVRSDGQPAPPKAGVYAVRAGPVLVQNLIRYLENLQQCKQSAQTTPKLEVYRPQEDFMKLIVVGSDRALGLRFGLALYGKWVLQMKDAIDQGFMRLFQNLPNDVPRREGEYDTSQYDANDPLALVNLPKPSEAASLIQRTDDEVNWKEAWLVLRTMTNNEDYRQQVLEHISSTKTPCTYA